MRLELKTKTIEINDKVAEKIKMNTALDREDFLENFYTGTCLGVEKNFNTWGAPLPSLDEIEEKFFNYVESVGLETVLNEMAFDNILKTYIDAYGVKRRLESGVFCELFSAISPLRLRSRSGSGMIPAVLRHISRGFIFGEETPLSR